MKNRMKAHGAVGYAGLATLCAMVAVLAWARLAPFGGRSLAGWDAQIQYLDFFLYLKGVLEGKNDILYTFSNTLGGTSIAVFAYYLASPFNLLVALFPRESLHTFFDLLVVLKITLAAMTCAVFLLRRFPGRLRRGLVVLLSLGYAMMQYNLTQYSNIMWLDGVYMLPLILLGVHVLARRGSLVPLSVTVGLSILFNWYTGGINCLFACVWLLLELALARGGIRRGLRSALAFAAAMALGVLLSAALFLPAMLSLRAGRGSMDWFLLGPGFVGSMLNVLPNLTLGAVSEMGSVSLYCGSVALVGCVALFFAKGIPLREKIVYGAFLCVVLLLFYWQPFVFAFSLLKQVTSYWYRYAYVGSFAIVFVAAAFFAGGAEGRGQAAALCKAGVALPAAVLALTYLSARQIPARVCLTALLMVCAALLLAAYTGLPQPRRRWAAASACLVLALSLGELTYNGILLTDRCYSQGVDHFKAYVPRQVEQIAALRAHDPSFYRVSQTQTAGNRQGQLTANYNEAMAYNYASISGYTSDPAIRQLAFLHQAGYRLNGANMCIVNTSVLPVDSLLGVKYVLSPTEIKGLQQVEALGVFNDKAVYANPYALPVAFTYPRGMGRPALSPGDPFHYQQQLYATLLGHDLSLYVQVPYAADITETAITFTLSVPEGEVALYGNIPWAEEISGMLYVDGAPLTPYGRWLSPSVFPIKAAEGAGEVTVRLEGERLSQGLREAPQFYALRLEGLAYAASALSARQAQDIVLSNGALSCVVEGKAMEALFVSIPYDEGWTVRINGKEVTPTYFADCLTSIPLQAGRNEITMTYRVRGLWAGVAMSLAGAAALVAIGLLTQRRRAAKPAPDRADA